MSNYIRWVSVARKKYCLVDDKIHEEIFDIKNNRLLIVGVKDP